MTSPWWFGHATCKRVVDGDTFDAIVDLGFGVSISQRFRLKGVNAPEANETGGADATRALKQFLPEGSAMGMKVWRADKYGRYEAEPDAEERGEVIPLLLEGGFVRPAKR